jgi:hypothetical protein
VGIEGLIGEQHIRPHVRQQCVSAHQVVGLTAGQMETNRIAEGIKLPIRKAESKTQLRPCSCSTVKMDATNLLRLGSNYC